MNKATVEFHSSWLGADVRVELGFDGEISHYQFGSIGPSTWAEGIYLAGVEISQHLRDSVVDVVQAEAEAAFKAQALEAA